MTRFCYLNIQHRLLPGSPSKARRLFGLAGVYRFVWNHFLAQNQEAYRLHQQDPANPKSSVSFFSLGKEFTKLRNSGEFPWLKEHSFAIAREPLRTMVLAFKAFFQGKGHSRFKAMGRDHPRFTIPDRVRIKGNHLRVPKVGWVELRRHGGNPHPEETPVKVSVVNEAGKGYATVYYKVGICPRPEPNLVAAMYRKLRPGSSGLQRRRQGEPSPNQGWLASFTSSSSAPNVSDPDRRRVPLVGGRTKLRIRKLHGRLRNIANNWRHRLTRHLADKARLVMLEKLNTQGMTASAKGTQEAPGTNVKAKSGLNRSIRQQGGLRLSRCSPTKYELPVSTPPFTSQRCARCGHVDARSRTIQAVFLCTSCGYQDHVDLNAANNILVSGIGATAQGEAFSGETSVICEIGGER